MIKLILGILVPISLFQIFIISFHLFIKKKGNLQNKILIGTLLIIWGIFISGASILLTPSGLFLSDVGHLMNLTIFLVAPVLYIYFCTIFKTQYKITFKVIYHAIPFLLIFAYIFSEIIIQRKLRYVFYPTAIYLISFLFAQNIIYYFLILKELKKVNSERKEKSKLNLFRILLLSTISLFLLKSVIFIIWNILKYTEICIFITGIFFIVVFIIVNFMVLFSLNNPDALTGTLKYQGNLLSEEELSAYLSSINTSLDENKLFTNPQISLLRLSKNLRISEKLLSQVINQASGLNYNDFINKFRINYALEMIKKEKSKKILEIAYECGFNSKTTFNTAFKKFTGVTPSQFRENLSSRVN
jgi:AraC-like DNA-binding protein